jgi:hypothetical protein
MELGLAACCLQLRLEALADPTVLVIMSDWGIAQILQSIDPKCHDSSGEHTFADAIHS